MNLAAKEIRLNKLMTEWLKAEKHLSKIAKQATKLREEILDAKITAAIQDNKITPQNFLDQDWNHIPKKWYDAFRKWFQENYHQKGLYPSGVWTETQQAAIQIKLDQNFPLEEQMGILDFLPHVKPNKEGAKLFGIFEHTCSEYAVWQLEIHPKVVKLIRSRTLDREFKTLNDAVKHIYQFHPYEMKRL